MVRMRDKATKLPALDRVSVFSASALGSFIVTLQGMQAIYDLIATMTSRVPNSGHPISSSFFPLAIFELIRLPAALWLTEKYGYHECEESEPPCQKHSGSSLPGHKTPRLQSSWRGILVRAFFVGVLIVLMVLTLCFFRLNFKSGIRTSSAAFISQLFYLFFLTSTFVIVSTFILREGNTTIIPCIQSTWYKAYTYLLFSLAVSFIVVSALETRRTKCGLYTTIPIDWGRDDLMCQFYTY